MGRHGDDDDQAISQTHGAACQWPALSQPELLHIILITFLERSLESVHGDIEHSKYILNAQILFMLLSSLSSHSTPHLA